MDFFPLPLPSPLLNPHYHSTSTPGGGGAKNKSWTRKKFVPPPFLCGTFPVLQGGQTNKDGGFFLLIWNRFFSTNDFPYCAPLQKNLLNRHLISHISTKVIWHRVFQQFFFFPSLVLFPNCVLPWSWQWNSSWIPTGSLKISSPPLPSPSPHQSDLPTGFVVCVMH